jgi:hypothetical protein
MEWTGVYELSQHTRTQETEEATEFSFLVFKYQQLSEFLA